jgi:dolichol-phosphate mannosyltransferase
MTDFPAPQPSRPAISVVFPAFNEAENVGPLVDEICAGLAELDGGFEIVAADDRSDDDTVAVLEARAAQGAPVRVVRHARRAGQSAAIVSAVRAARADAVATLDGDGQNDPADIPALFKTWSEAADRERLMVCGWRAERKDTWIKRVSSKLANAVRGRLLRDDTPDTGCGLKVFPRAAFLAFPAFNHMHRFMPALMIRAGGRVTSVKVNHRPRQRGVSKYGTLDRLAVGVFDLIGVLWLIRRPLNPEVRSDTPADESPEAS